MPRSSSAPSAGSLSRWAGSLGRLWLWPPLYTDLKDGAGSDDVADADHVRQEPRPHGLQSHEPVGLRQINNVLCFAGVHVNDFSTSTCFPAAPTRHWHGGKGAVWRCRPRLPAGPPPNLHSCRARWPLHVAPPRWPLHVAPPRTDDHESVDFVLLNDRTLGLG